MLLILAEHAADVQAAPHELLFGGSEVAEHFLQAGQGRDPAKFANDVRLGLGHDERAADRPAPLRDDTANLRRPIDQRRRRAMIVPAAADKQAILPRSGPAACHPAEHGYFGMIL